MNRQRRASSLVAVAIALAAMLFGLGALAAASLGHAGYRLPGFALLVVGGSVASIARWRRERAELAELDREAVFELEAARRSLEQGEHAAAMAASSRATASAKTSRTRNAALVTLAWAALGQGYPERAKATLDRIKPFHALDVHCLAAIESALGNPELAIAVLEGARAAHTLTCDGAKLLVDCYVRRHGMDQAVIAALQNRELLGTENCKMVVKAACDAGAHAAAAKLTAALRSDPRALQVIEDAHAG